MGKKDACDEGGGGLQEQTPFPEDGDSWQWCPRSLPFPLPLFLQALGCLGVNDKFIMEALWQVVSLGLHGVQERRKQG